MRAGGELEIDEFFSPGENFYVYSYGAYWLEIMVAWLTCFK